MKKVIFTILSLAMVANISNAQNFKAQNAMATDKASSRFDIARIISIDPIEIIAERIEKIMPNKQDRKNKSVELNSFAMVEPVVFMDSTRKTDTTEIKVGKTRIVVIGEPKIEKIYIEKDTTGDFDDIEEVAIDKRRDEKNHDSFEWSIGYNGWLDNGSTSLSAANKSLELKNNKSVNFNMTYHKQFNIIKENLQISAGLGVDWNNYRLSRNVSLKQNSDSMNIYYDSTATFEKNKLMSCYATLPIMLHFRTNENKSGNRFSITSGVEFGYLIFGRLKQISEERGKQKLNDDFNFLDLRYGLVTRMSYGNFGVYGKYYPQGAFKPTEGPDLNTFAIGVTFGIE